MAIQRTDGIVIRMADWSETSKIITFYTQNFGKLKAIAKGVKRRKIFGNVLELFTHLDLVYYEKQTRDLQIIKEVSLIESFQEIRENLLKIAQASYLVELVNGMVRGKEENQDLFRLLINSLKFLRSGKNEEVKLLTPFFEVHLLKLLGYKPLLDYCVSCKKRIEKREVKFSAHLGGILCGRCQEKDKNSISISKGILPLLRYLSKTHLTKLARLKISPPMYEELKSLLHHYLTYLMEGEIKSLGVLQEVIA